MKFVIRLLMVLLAVNLYSSIQTVYAANTDQKIQLLSNRFRVDQAVEKIVFIIERKPGSAPIILVRPDGSKLYANRKVDKVKWMDGNTGDMIEIANPMIGPWQIIGDILPSSEIRLATSLALKVEPIPETLFVGEQIKLTSRLEFNDRLLSLGQVDDLIKLNVYLRATDDENSENFGAGTFIIGEYLDNGVGFDERMGDGVFTSVFDLDKPAGPYTLMVKAVNKVFERETSRQVTLLNKPIKVDLLSAAIDGNYALRFFTNSHTVNLNELAIQIKVTHPDETIEHLSIVGVASTHIYRLEKVSEPGRYKIELDIAGQTADGRDFTLALDDIKFKVALPAKQQQIKDQIALDKAREAKFKQEQEAKRALAKRQQEEKDQRLIIVIVLVNFLILLIGGVMMWLFLRTKKPKAVKEDKKEAKKDSADKDKTKKK